MTLLLELNRVWSSCREKGREAENNKLQIMWNDEQCDADEDGNICNIVCALCICTNTDTHCTHRIWWGFCSAKFQSHQPLLLQCTRYGLNRLHSRTWISVVYFTIGLFENLLYFIVCVFEGFVLLVFVKANGLWMFRKLISYYEQGAS